MPWVRAKLRGQVVYARADAAGALQPEASGRVEIRYKPNDGRRYEARPANLEVADPKPLPDGTCGAAEAVEKPAKGAAGAATKSAGGGAAARATTRPARRSRRTR